MIAKRITQILFSMLLGAVVAGCTGEDESALLTSITSHLQKGEHKAAELQLKTLLQSNPDSAKGRFLLGKLLLDRGDVLQGAIELRKASDLHHPGIEVAPALAKSMLMLGKNSEVVAEFSTITLSDPKAISDVKSMVALANVRLGKLQAAEQALQLALAASPEYPPALLVQARIKAIAGDTTGALVLADRVTTLEPANAGAWLFRGYLQSFGNGNADAAVSSFRKSLEIDGTSVAAHAAIVDVLLSKQDFDGARRQLVELKREMPAHPETKLLEARFAILDKDYSSAIAITQDLLRRAPDNVKYLHVMALAQFKVNSLTQASVHLHKLLQLAPESATSRRMLAQVYLRSGDTTKALEALRPIMVHPNPDAETLAIAAAAYLQSGNLKNAEEYFGKAAKSSPGDPKIRTALAATQLAKGNSEAAFSELAEVAAADKGVVAEMALISAHLRRREFDSALKAVDSLQRKQPTSPVPSYLRGRVSMDRQDAKGARRSFTEALVIDSNYFPATASMAAMDVVEGKPEDARQRFEALLKSNPKNVQALMALAEIRVRQKADKAEVAGLLQSAIRAGPTEEAPRLMLVEHHLTRRDFKLALTAAQEAQSALPDNPDVLDALGRAQMVSGDVNQAIKSFTRMLALQPKASRPHLRMAAARTAGKDYEGAILSFKRALDVSPGLVEAQRGLITLYLETKRPNDAILVARNVQKERPNDAVGFLFEGEIAVRQANWDAAAVAFRAGLAKPNPGELPIRLHKALLSARKADEANRFAVGWLRDHPRDIRFTFYLGDNAQARNDFAAAERYYRGVLAIEPRSALAANNVAWAMMQQHKPGSVAYAEKAVSLMPGSAPVLDTLAWSYAESNEPSKAIATGKKAVTLVPANLDQRLSLARLYIKVGDKPQAKVELEKLASLGSSFGRQAEVAQLRLSLND